MGRTMNKNFYHFKVIEDKEVKIGKYFKTLQECATYYNCSTRLLGYKLKNNNLNTKGKLYNIFIYKCYEPVVYKEVIQTF